MRPIVDFDSPDLAAIEVRDQWVASFGVCSSVATTTASTRSMLTDAGRPGRSSSASPSRRAATNLARYLPTVTGAHRSCAATSLLLKPCAHANTILHRNANAWADFARLDQRSNVARSSSLSTNAVLGRPVLAIRTRLSLTRRISDA